MGYLLTREQQGGGAGEGFVAGAAYFFGVGAVPVEQAAAGVEADPRAFRRYGSARRLYNFNVDRADEY